MSSVVDYLRSTEYIQNIRSTRDRPERPETLKKRVYPIGHRLAGVARVIKRKAREGESRALQARLLALQCSVVLRTLHRLFNLQRVKRWSTLLKCGTVLVTMHVIERSVLCAPLAIRPFLFREMSWQKQERRGWGRKSNGPTSIVAGSTRGRAAPPVRFSTPMCLMYSVPRPEPLYGLHAVQSTLKTYRVATRRTQL